MRVLYIPFYEENDLITPAIRWKETRKDQNILIIQHGKPINYKAMEKQLLIIYVLAHGIDNLLEQSHLASHGSITNQTTHLGIDTIAERFNSDFVYLHHRIRDIKLYFCNNKGNQQTIAEKFNSHLVLFDAFINYYAGTLFSPSTDKKKYSYCHGQWHSSSNVRSKLRRTTCSEPNKEISIKQLSMLNFFENAKQQRIDSILKRQKRKRQELFMQKRNEIKEPHGEKIQTEVLDPPILYK